MSDPSGLMVDCGNGYCGLPACNNGGATAGSSRDPGGCNVNCSNYPAASKWVNRGAIDVDLTPIKKKPRRWYQPVRNLVAGFGDRISEQWRGLEDASCFVSQEGHPWGCGSAPMTELARPSNAVRALTGADDPDIDRTSRGYKTGRVIADLVGPIPLIAPAAIEQTAAVTATRAATRAAAKITSRAERGAVGGERLLWTSWQNYPKVTQGGREYAQIGDRLYSHHAVDRLQPSGLGAPAGATGAGRSISPNFLEDVLGSTRGVPVKGPNGEPRLSFVSGSVQVITENDIVITVITR